MNIVLVVFDSLRKDCIGHYGSPPWGKVNTPNFNSLAKESLTMNRAYPESLPTLPARRALYTGQNVYPFYNSNFRLKGDFAAAPGWGPIPEEQDTLAEILKSKGYRTALISDVYHMFKPSKNFWRGFDQWMFLRGQETDLFRSGPQPSQEEIDKWLPKKMQNPLRIWFISQALMNMHDRIKEEDYFNSRVLIEASRWLEQNRDAERIFLVVESFDPHEPWFVPEYYRRIYDDSDGPEQVLSPYSTDDMSPELLHRTRANYSGLVTMCDRWFGHFYQTLHTVGLLDNTLLILTTDHGHSIGDFGYMGKRGYPSSPEVIDIPIMIRHPEGIGAGKRSDMLVQHTDLSALILDMTNITPKSPIDGKPFWKAAVGDEESIRDHITVGWGSAITVIDKRWWLNCKINGKGIFLHDLSVEKPFSINVADENIDLVKNLFEKAVADADGDFPDYMIKMAEGQDDQPGCSELAARSLG
jgi:arylsulfatase A-like enzyme